MQENAQLDSLSFYLDEDGRNVIASFTSTQAADDITFNDLKRDIDATGFGGYSLDEPALQDALAKYNSGESFEIVVGKAVDGEFTIHIDANELNAYLTCILPRGGAPVMLEHIYKEIERRKIIQEIDNIAIKKALAEGGENILIASGKSAVDGVDGRLESLVPDANERNPRIDENGIADFRELGGIPVVHIGDKLMRRVLPTSGEPGSNLFGKIIPPKPGNEIVYAAKLEGAALDPNNQDLLNAVIDGTPVLQKNGMSVEPVYSIQDVDLRVGNIDFLGAINVKGDIKPGMTIKASGDIHINSTVDGVTLIAGGDIVVKGGIIGSTEQGNMPRSSITCEGSCNANFVQNAYISAGQGIFIRDTAMQSELSAGHQIIVGDQGSRMGHLIGGVARAGVLVKAQVIGSPARVKTVVIAGPDQALHDKLVAIAEARSAATNKLFQVSKLLELARTKPDRIPPETVKAAEATRVATNAELAKLLQDEDEVKREQAIGENAKVVAEKQFLEGTEIRFGSKCQSLVADRQGGYFRLQGDKLVLV